MSPSCNKDRIGWEHEDEKKEGESTRRIGTRDAVRKSTYCVHCTGMIVFVCVCDKVASDNGARHDDAVTELCLIELLVVKGTSHHQDCEARSL